MFDDLDIYISHTIKNWAAQHRPPASGRNRLLQAVLTPPHSIRKSWQPWRDMGFWLFAPLAVEHSIWPLEPVIISRYTTGQTRSLQLLTTYCWLA